MTKIALYCRCGAAWKGTIPGIREDWFRRKFTEAHTGEGHAACSAAEARRARALEERDR